jgi:hypothetical protein
MKTGARFLAIAITFMMIVPTLVVTSDDSRSPDLIRHITTLGDGSSEGTATFAGVGTDTKLELKIPNGATIVSATFNVSGEPYSQGSKDFPENVTIDVGDDGDVEWKFEGTGFGYLGRQYLVSNTTNFTESLRIPFYSGGTNDTVRIRLPKEANVTKAVLKLEGSSGTGPSNISQVNKMQSWAPNMWVTQGSQIMVNQLNGQILYDTIEFNIGSIPSTAFVSNATFYWGRKGTSYYGQNPQTYSFADPLGIHRIEESWSLGNTKILDESSPPEDINMMTNKNVFYPWNMTQIMASWVEGTHTNYGVCIHRTQAATRDKWDYSWLPFILVKYGSPGNVSMVMKGGADVQIYSQTGTFATSTTVPDFSDDLNNYLTSHVADFTDDYGNGFVDIPFSLSSTDPGRVTISEVDIQYEYYGAVDQNPTTVNLTNELNDLVPDVIDGGHTDITIAISSNNSGKVKISGIDIDFLPPDHAADIDTRSPEDFTVIMNENETIEFEITASDLYDYPLTVVWTMDDEVYVEGEYNMTYFADFESAGSYNITVVVNNGLHDTSTSWDLVVKNVNRKPLFDWLEPDQNYAMDENSTTIFNVTAHDPDGDIIRYVWSLDNNPVGTNDPAYKYEPGFDDSGSHVLKVTLLDPWGLDNSRMWYITVNNVNAPPVITDSDPVREVTMLETETKRFTVEDDSLDGDPHDIIWYLDSNDTGEEGDYYDYVTDYDSAGLHLVEVEVTDGEYSAWRRWDVTVLDVNRPPVPVIDAPQAQDEFLEWDDILLDGTSTSDPDGDALELAWSEGSAILGKGEQVTVNLDRGQHTIILSVDDGRPNGEDWTEVVIMVRYIDFETTITPDIPDPVVDDEMKITVDLYNAGDGSIDELEVYLLVDGENVSSQYIRNIEPDKEFSLEFPWTAELGEHTIEIVVGDQNFTKTVKVDEKPIINEENSWLWLLIVVIVVCCVIGGVVVMKRRKKAPSELPPEEPAPAPPPQEPVQQFEPAPTQPVPEQPADVYPPPPPPPPLAEARPVPDAPLPIGLEAQAKNDLAEVEALLQEREATGANTTKARGTIRIAKNFLSKGNYDKAIHYCNMARNHLK